MLYLQHVLGRRPSSEHVTATHCNGTHPLRTRIDPKLKAGDRNLQQRPRNSMGTAFQQRRQHSWKKTKTLHPVCQMLQKRLPQDKLRRGKHMGTVFHHQQHCRPSWCKAESLKRRRNDVHRRMERRPRLSLEEGIAANQGAPFLFFSFSLPFPLFLSFSCPSLPFLSFPTCYTWLS